MKIGILTFHRAINYGAVLQCYALCEVLKGMGHDVEVIDYRPPYIEKYRSLLYRKVFKKLRFVAKLKYISLMPINYIHRRKSASVFDSFITKYLKISSTVKDINHIPNDYSAIIFGSDQIWSPRICEEFDPVFWGQLKKDRTKFIVYSASLGEHNQLSTKDWKEIGRMIKSFDFVSVREMTFQLNLRQQINYNAIVTLDPTLLAPRKIFDDIAVKPKEDKYVLLYTVEKSEMAYLLAKRVAQERNCKLIRLKAIAGIRNKENLYLRDAVSPAEFLGYFKYAEFIVTVSFHGTAFSLIFNKNFYTVHSQKEDRAFNLLNSVGLSDRLVNPFELKYIEDVNHSDTDMHISKIRKDSIEFLMNSLSDR